MLYVKPFDQTSGLCGPASLKMVLDFFGVEKSEEELAQMTDTHPHHGATAENIVRAAKKLGFQGEIHNLASFNDIKKWLSNGVPVIVSWFSKDDGHYSVVVDLDEKKIYLQDPEIGGINELPLETFFRVWFDFNGNFINSKDDLILRQMIVVHR